MNAASNTTDPWRNRQPIMCDCGDHAFVAITQGLTTMVSPGDAELLRQPWYARRARSGLWRVSRERLATRSRDITSAKRIDLSQAVLNPATGMLADHKSGDTLDNRRSNLRSATGAENARNRRPKRRPYPKGVCPSTCGVTFQASIVAKGKRYYLGTFKTPEAAGAAYAEAARKLHGEFGRVA